MFTQTIPALLAGGACWAAGFDAAAGLDAVVDAAGAVLPAVDEVGAVATAGAVFAAGVVAALEDEAGVVADVDVAAGVDALAAEDFFELRVFLVGVESAEAFESAAAVAAGIASSAVAFFDLEDFFLEVAAAELSAEVDAFESAEACSDFFDLDFDFGLELESDVVAPEDCVESSAAVFFFDFAFGLAPLLSL